MQFRSGYKICKFSSSWTIFLLTIRKQKKIKWANNNGELKILSQGFFLWLAASLQIILQIYLTNSMSFQLSII